MREITACAVCGGKKSEKQLPVQYCPSHQYYCLFENGCSYAELVTKSRAEAESFIKSRDGRIIKVKSQKNHTGAVDYIVEYKTRERKG